MFTTARTMMHGTAPVLAGILLAVGLSAGCNDGSEASFDGNAGTLQVALTDAPSDYIASAEVTISEVYAISAADDSRFDLLDPADAPRTFDLLELRDGLEAFLAERPVPEDVYGQLRLVVERARVTLIEGETFDDGTVTRDLFVPSGAQSGIKVQLDEPLEVEEGEVTLVVVDFDVDESFVIQGNPETPAGIKGILFTPVLEEKRRERMDPGPA
jgi:hypothetical protein